jgi:hypothetical protein
MVTVRLVNFQRVFVFQNFTMEDRTLRAICAIEICDFSFLCQISDGL